MIAHELPAGSALLWSATDRSPASSPRAPREAPLQGRVRMLGRISDEELIDVYRAADVAVVPTLAVEGFGLVVLEAAACGTPSVVTDVDGLRDAAAPLDASLIVPPADAAALGSRAALGSTGRAAGADGHARVRRALRLAAAGGTPPATSTVASRPASATGACASSTSTTWRGCPAARSRSCGCCPTSRG